MAGGIRLAPLLTEIKVDIENFKKNLKEAGKAGQEEAEKISKKLTSTARVGEALSKAGDRLTKGLTLPIAGAAVAATKMSVDFESSFAKVSTLLDDTVVDFSDYKDSLIEGSNKTKVAVDEYSESVYQAISAGVDQTKAVEFTTEAMKLAKGGFTSGASAVDILTTAINGYNLKAEDATEISDMLITTQNLGKTTVDELSQSMGRVIPIASSVNFGMEELSAAYAQLTKNGIATAEAGTYLKQMLSELGKTGSEADKALREMTGKGFAELKAEGVETSEILNMMSAYAEQNNMTLKDMFGSVEAGSAALVLAKSGGQEYNDMLDAMKESAGATQKAFDKMDATPAEKLKGSLNELRNAGIKFGGAFVPVVDKVSDMLTKAADAFSGLSEEQQQNIIKWGALLAAVGPVMKVTGGVISTYKNMSVVMGAASKALGIAGGSSGLIGGMTGLLGTCAPIAAGAALVGTGLYAMHENAQLMNRSVVESKEELSLMERALAKLNGIEVRSRQELEEMGLVYKDFGENISPEFQKAVEDATKKVHDFGVFVNEIGFDGVITEEESSEFVSRVEGMCEEAISTVSSKAEESQSALKDLFIADDQIIDESEQRVLDMLAQSSESQINEISSLKERILEIEAQAQAENRALREDEIAEIEAHNARVAQIQLEALGGTQEEIAYAKNEFNARIQTMDVNAATELLQEKASLRDEEIVQIQAGYDTQIEKLKAMLEEKEGAEKEDLEKQIANLEADKQQKIDVQNQLWDDLLQIVKEKNPAILDEINRYNGEILAKGDQTAQNQLNNMMDMYAGLDQITQTGCYQIWNQYEGHWERMRVTVDSNTGEITGAYSEFSDRCGGYTAKMADDARAMAADQTDSYHTIVDAMGWYVEESGLVRDANGNVVASMQDLEEQTDGTRQGIVNINETPCEITVNKEGTVQALQSIGSEADNAARPRTITFTTTVVGSVSGGIRGAFSPNFNGLDNVPYDGYRALLHKGERVLTAEENKSYSSGQDMTDYKAIRSIIRSELKGIVIRLNDREVGRAVRGYV